MLLRLLLNIAYPLRKLLQSVLVDGVLILKLCEMISIRSCLESHALCGLANSPCCLREFACDEA